MIPVYRCADLLQELMAELAVALDELPYPVEIVFVEDGSPDESLEVLRALQSRNPQVRIVELAGNFGQHAAISAGFEHARGEYIISMDADLQFDPREMGRLLEPLEQGADFVSGIRTGRRDPLMRRMFSRLINWMAQSPASVALDDVGCPYNALTRQVARDVAAFGEMRRFLKPTVARVAHRVQQVEVRHRPRPGAGRRSTYTPTRLVRLFMDFASANLIDVFAWIFVAGLAAGGVSALTTLALAVAVLAGWLPPVALVLALSSTILAMGISLFGLAGDFVQRTYRHTSGRPFYRVRYVHEMEAEGRSPTVD